MDNEADKLAGFYLGDQDHQPALDGVIRVTRDYLAGHPPAGGASRRRSELERASAHAKGLRHLLGNIDHQAIVVAMGPGTGGKMQEAGGPFPEGGFTGSSWSLRRGELAYAMDVLERLTRGLAAAADREKPLQHRPGVRDPILFGVEALAALWVEARKEAPTASFKEKEFGDFALAVLGQRGLKCDEPTVYTAVRYVVRAQKAPRLGAGSPQSG